MEEEEKEKRTKKGKPENNEKISKKTEEIEVSKVTIKESKTDSSEINTKRDKASLKTNKTNIEEIDNSKQDKQLENIEETNKNEKSNEKLSSETPKKSVMNDKDTNSDSNSINNNKENLNAQSNKKNFIESIKTNLPTQEINNPVSHIAEEPLKEKQPLTNEQKLKIKKLLVILGCCIVGVYLIGIIVFNLFTYPNTSAADTDLSFKNSNSVKDALTQQSDVYELEIDALGDNYSIAGNTIDYEFEADRVTKRIFELQNVFLWPYEVFTQHNFADENLANFNSEKVIPQIENIIEDHNSRAASPVNAGFNIDIQTKNASQKNEIIGTTLDTAKTTAEIYKHINSASRKCVLNESSQVLPEVVTTNPNYSNSLQQANKALQSNINLIMGSSNVGTFNSSIFGNWLEINPDYSISINHENTYAWSETFSSEHSTLGSTRTFTTPDGKTTTVSGGTVGWKVDTYGLCVELENNSLVGTDQNLEVPCSSKSNKYEPGGKDWGTRYIDVDLSSQHAKMYDDSGAIIWQSDFVSGKPDGHQTPTGVWSILYKQSPASLRPAGETTSTPVAYWMPFTSDGVGLHDATWQSSFGGSRYLQYGSHGCLNLPYSAAGSLYSIVNTGDIVVVHG